MAREWIGAALQDRQRLWAEELAALFVKVRSFAQWKKWEGKFSRWGSGDDKGMMSSSVFPPKLSSSEKYGKGEEKLEIYFPVHEGISWRDAQWETEKADMLQVWFYGPVIPEGGVSRPTQCEDSGTQVRTTQKASIKEMGDPWMEFQKKLHC